MSTVPLRRLVHADQWVAEDLAGRLGIVAHAAFLRAGFVPYGDEPSSGHLLKHVDEIGPSAPSLSRRYTAAQLARREQGAEVAVLELRARGNGDVAFQAYLLTRDGGGRRCLCQAILDEAALAPLLPCRLADAARALETESAGAWLWRSLADWVSRVLLLELCRRNGLPVTGFTSLPDDAVAEILKRLPDGEDLARVECTSRQLRRLVTERDGELWKAVYESGQGLLPGARRTEPLGSWKERYVNARRQQRLLFSSHDEDDRLLRLTQFRRELREAVNDTLWTTHRVLFSSHDEDEDDDEDEDEDEDERFPRLAQLLRERREAVNGRLWDWQLPLSIFEDSFIIAPREPTVAPATEMVARGKNAGRQHRKVPRNDYRKKRHGAGAINSPSSRYRWNHR